MANCNANFRSGDNSFLSRISLSENRTEQLLNSSNALREKIREYLQDKKVGNPRFYRQGSYIHHTLVRPLNEDYDLDDGVYLDLSGFSDTPSPVTIHNWIYSAVEDHTQTPPTDKETCVRANFKDGFHIDLPSYLVMKNTTSGSEEYHLAQKTKGWVPSDPRAMTNWFSKMVGIHSEQLRRVVKYAKAWVDYRETNGSFKLLNGHTITILISEQFQSDTRDDIAFFTTLNSIKDRLAVNGDIWKPYQPTENLANSISEAAKIQFTSEIDLLCSNGQLAIEADNRKDGSLLWREILGERFPIIDDENGTAKQAHVLGAAAILGGDKRSAINGIPRR